MKKSKVDRRDAEILERSYREYTGEFDFLCTHDNRDVFVCEDGLVRFYCYDCRFHGFTSMGMAEELGLIEDLCQFTT